MSDYSWNSNPWVFAVTFKRVNEPPSGKPILFSGAMVRAILRDKDPKTQTRRVIVPQPQRYEAGGGWGLAWGKKCRGGSDWLAKYCPYGKPGDRLYVRESWYCDHCAGPCYGNTATPDEARGPRSDAMPHGEYMYYAADGDIDDQMPERDGPVKWRPSIHMPKWASRITLEITEVRVQRLQEISAEDAIAEGSYLDRCACMPRRADRTPMDKVFRQTWCHIHGTRFQELWDDINGKRGPKQVKVAA